MGSLSWYNLANCRSEDPRIFFDETGKRKEAEEICGKCPVSDLCLFWAIANEEQGNRHGTYGGVSANQRDRMARELGITKEKARKIFEQEMTRLGLR